MVIACLALGVIIIGLLTPIGNAKPAASINCRQTGTVYVVAIKNNRILPDHTLGKLCDKMTIVNKDNTVRLIAFGPHTHHTPYDGITESVLSQNQSLTVVYNQEGNFQFHDHLNDNVRGTFTVIQ